MKTQAVRLYGKSDLRLEEFDLPSIKKDEILARVVSDSVCMSTYKAVILGSDHKRIPEDVGTNPVIIGHEFSGEIIEVGERWKHKFKSGDKFAIQPNINYKGLGYCPGMSFPNVGGDATYVIIPGVIMEKDCLLDYSGNGFYQASLAEPMSCIVAAFHASYHISSEDYSHKMGIVEGGRMAILAGAGPMGLGAIDYAINSERKPAFLVVTDNDDKRLRRAASILTVEEAAKNGVELVYVNTKDIDKKDEFLLSLVENKGYDDVFAFTPVREVAELGDRILGYDGCLNFFAGAIDKKFSANVNFYNVHYQSTHITGTCGGNTADMSESLVLMEKGLINPAVMVTHIGGLDSAIDTTLNLPDIPGGKKLIYPHVKMELTAIEDFQEKGKQDPVLKTLAEIVERNNGLWSVEAEKYLLSVKNI